MAVCPNTVNLLYYLLTVFEFQKLFDYLPSAFLKIYIRKVSSEECQVVRQKAGG